MRQARIGRWASDSEQKKLADIFAIQDRITCQIVTELQVKLCGETAPASRSTQNVKVYQLYLQGLYQRNLVTKGNLQNAIAFYEEALRLEPNYALAHAGLAEVYMVMEFNSLVAPGTAAPKAELHAQKALELDGSLAGPYTVLGAVRTMQNYDLKTRENYYQQALLKNPNHPTAHLWLANNLTVQGRFEEAEREILRVQELDPLSFGVRWSTVNGLSFSGSAGFQISLPGHLDLGPVSSCASASRSTGSAGRARTRRPHPSIEPTAPSK